MCPSAAQTNALLDLAGQNRVPIMCGLVERFNPAVIAAMTMIEGPRFVRIERHSPYAPRIKTGVAWDLLMHDLDMALRLFGQRNPSAFDGQVGYFHPSSHQGAEDVVEASLRFDAGELVSTLGKSDRPTQAEDDGHPGAGSNDRGRSAPPRRHCLPSHDDRGRDGSWRVPADTPRSRSPRSWESNPSSPSWTDFVKLARGEVDVDAERESVRPSHDIIESILGSSDHQIHGRRSS